MIRYRNLYGAGLALMAVSGASTGAQAAPLAEVLHFWTSGGEAAALSHLIAAFESEGGEWVDAPVAGGGGGAAMQALRARVLAGDPPTAVQLKGPQVREWSEAGALVSIDDIATAGDWDAKLYPIAAEASKCGGSFCAAPILVHRVDWLWANTGLLERAGVDLPTTWEEFNSVAETLQGMGITPLAHGGQAWQDTILFENVALGMGGPDFYKRAFVDLDEATLRSDTMKSIFDEMRILRGYVDDNFSGRDWNLATAMVINGEAAFQVMGDWAKGEFTAAGKVPGEDYFCTSLSGPGYIFDINTFGMFAVTGEDREAGQVLLAKKILDPELQIAFNQAKGSIPALRDVDPERFDVCARMSIADLSSASDGGTVVPSVAVDAAQSGELAGAIKDVVTAHFNSDMTSQQAVDQLVAGVNQAR